jgi:hypothetical protein
MAKRALKLRLHSIPASSNGRRYFVNAEVGNVPKRDHSTHTCRQRAESMVQSITIDDTGRWIRVRACDQGFIKRRLTSAGTPSSRQTRRNREQPLA